MSIGPLGFISTSAGMARTQSAAADAERSAQDTAAQDRVADSSAQAEAAAGVGRTAEEQQAGDRDADGRRLWERARKAKQDEAAESEPAPPRAARDPSGDCGTNLDLSG